MRTTDKSFPTPTSPHTGYQIRGRVTDWVQHDLRDNIYRTMAEAKRYLATIHHGNWGDYSGIVRETYIKRVQVTDYRRFSELPEAPEEPDNDQDSGDHDEPTTEASR